MGLIMRFHVPANILSADYSPLLADRGVTLMRHTLDNDLQLHGKPVPCRLREALFPLDDGSIRKCGVFAPERSEESWRETGHCQSFT